MESEQVNEQFTKRDLLFMWYGSLSMIYLWAVTFCFLKNAYSFLL
jgi:hypothetical protein